MWVGFPLYVVHGSGCRRGNRQLSGGMADLARKTYRPLPALLCVVGVAGCEGCAGCMESPFFLLVSTRVPIDEDDPSQWGGATW
jgi:hypothetical protein